jgi:hypothetical protein
VSALLVFGLLVSVSFSAAKAAPLGEPRREPVSERVAVRQISASLVKAARRLVGSDSHKPVAAVSVRPVARVVAERVAGAPLIEGVPAAPALLRAAILDLPPPARAA